MTIFRVSISIKISQACFSISISIISISMEGHVSINISKNLQSIRGIGMNCMNISDNIFLDDKYHHLEVLNISGVTDYQPNFILKVVLRGHPQVRKTVLASYFSIHHLGWLRLSTLRSNQTLKIVLW